MRPEKAIFPRTWTGNAVLFACATLLLPAVVISQQSNVNREVLSVPGELGRAGGRAVVSLRAEPKTLNPLTAVDAPSREVIGTMHEDLIHINRATQMTEAALAKSWQVSPDGLKYTVVLRKELRFSDGQPLDADDVIFTMRVYLDENVHATQRDLLIVGGKPITVRQGICWKNLTKKESWPRPGRLRRLRISGREQGLIV